MEIMEHEGFGAAWPGIVDGARLIGSIQIRGRATLGGNLCNASPAADSVPALIAAGALAQVVGPDGRRAVPVEDIATAPGRTSLADGEIVVSFDLPERKPRSGDAYLRFTPRTEMDIAVVGVGVNLALDEAGICTEARVALGAVAERALPVDEAAAALIGTRVDDAALAALSAGRLGRLPADRRQAGHQGIQDRGRRRSRRTGGPDRAATGGAELMARYHVTTTVNGDEVDFLCESDQTLLSVLRDELVMTGTKEGCGTGDCGACSVTVDDRLMCSCLVLGVEVEGKRVETIEGMADGEALHPLQQKFLEHAALQCGICTPGLLVASRALLARNPDPSESGNPLLARRQSLPLHRLSQDRRGGGRRRPRDEGGLTMATMLKYEDKDLKVVGTRPIRPDGVDKVTGRARYGADINLPGQLYGRVVRSPHAHARVLAIRTGKAEAVKPASRRWSRATTSRRCRSSTPPRAS